MKFLIAGFGSIGRRHLNNLRQLGETDILLYRTHHSTLPGEETRDTPVETDLQKALEHKPDAVIIANPTALHLPTAIPCAEAGCSILMEKPISHSMAEIETLRKALEKGGGQFLTGFQFRFHPGLQQVKRWLADNAIGSVISVKSQWGEYLPDWHPWEDYRTSYSARIDLGGGVVNTLCHPLDYLRWFFGDVEDLFALTSNNGLYLPVEDNADILMKFECGTTANIHLDYNQRPGQHTLELTGSRGRITWDNEGGAARWYDARTKVWEEITPPAGFERNTLFLAEMAHFMKVAKKEEAPSCTLEDGVAALRLTLAVHASAREGCLVKFNQNSGE